MSQTLVFNYWETEALALLGSRPPNDTYLLLHDLSTQAVGFLFSNRMRFDVMHPGVTPAGQIRAFEILRNRPDLRVRLAVIVSEFQSGKFVYRRASKNTPTVSNLSAQMFFDQDSAVEWLQQKNAPDRLVFDHPFS